MAVFLARNILFLAVVFATGDIRTLSVQTCKFVTKLTCWASCELANCGILPENPDSFTQCDWTVKSAPDAKNYTFTSILQGESYGKPPCNPSRSKCDVVTGACFARFVLSNCSVITMVNTNLDFQVKAHYGENECRMYTRYKICQSAKPERPVVIKKSLDIKHQKILLTTNGSTCPGNVEKTVRLNYTRFDGARTIPTIASEASMLYRPASRYNYTLEFSKGGNVYSDPATGFFLTGPDKVPAMSITIQCLSRSKGKMNISITWKKKGIIDWFAVNISETETGNLSYRATVKRESPTQTENSLSAEVLAGKIYVVSIVARNQAGESAPSRKLFNASRCVEPKPIDCFVKSRGRTWMEMEWRIESDPDLQFKVRLSNHLQPTKRETLDSKQRSYNMTDLQECTQYNISVCSVCDGNNQACCKSKNFTKGPAPLVTSGIEIKPAAKSLTVKISENRTRVGRACGKALKHLISYRLIGGKDVKKKETKSGSRDVTLQPLKPNSKYVISISAFDDNGFGERVDFVVSTLEAAPDDPPEVTRAFKDSNEIHVSWNSPRMLNGNVTYYHVLFYLRERKSNQSLNEEDCDERSEGFLCVFEAERHSATVQLLDAVTNVSVRACIGNGSQCSEWSQSSEIVKYDEGSPLLLIILCTGCGLMLVLVVTVGVIYRCRAQGSRPPKPRLPAELQRDFEKLLNGKTEKNSTNTEKPLEIKTGGGD